MYPKVTRVCSVGSTEDTTLPETIKVDCTPSSLPDHIARIFFSHMATGAKPLLFSSEPSFVTLKFTISPVAGTYPCGAVTSMPSKDLNSVEAMLTALEKLQLLIDDLNELKYGYMNLQAVCDTTQAIVANEVNPKLDSIGTSVDEINNKLATLPAEEDYNRLVEAVATKADETAQTYSRQVVDAISALPTAENIDYSRIVEEVGDKVLDLLNQVNTEPAEETPVEATIDYDRIICGAAEKVIESLPYPEKVDYSRFGEEFDYERLANLVAEKMTAPEVDYERLADMVMEKMSATTEKSCEVMLDEAGIEEIAVKVANKIPTPETIDYDRVCQAAQAAQILPDPVDYDRIAEIVEEK